MNQKKLIPPVIHAFALSCILSTIPLAAAGTVTVQGGAALAESVNIGTRLEMFIDHYLIESLRGARLKLAEPRPAGAVIKYENLWEAVPTGTATILQDGSLYRLYYTALPSDYKSEAAESNLCYAESKDGVTWIKPDLGLAAFRGSKQNNILLPGNIEDRYTANFSPFLDNRPGVAAAERYKAVGGVWPKGLYVLVSPDGIHWRKWREAAVFSKGAFDSQNVIFWSEAEHCYVLYFRVFTGWTDYTAKSFQLEGFRSISRTTSPDLINWSEPQRMSFGPTPLEHLYENRTHPYARAPHIYLAYPMRFVPGRAFLSAERLAELKVLPSYLNIKGNTHNIPLEVSDTVLLTSRGGSRYDRTFMEAFVRPGLDEANWVSRNGIAAIGTLQTSPTELSIFIGQHYAQPSAYLGRFTLRLDGFASVNAPYAGGEMLTKPIVVTGETLVLNCATSAQGGVRVEVQTAEGEPWPGFTLMEADEFVGDSIATTVKWKSGASLSSLLGKTVRLHFVMSDADIYSLRFR